MKIDINKIAGYAEMSAEDKIKALEGFDMEIGSDWISKKAYDKAASELADYKRKLKEHQSDEENAAAEREAKVKDLENKYNELLKTSTIASYKTQFMSSGYDEKLAAETAEAMYSGDTAKVFANQSKFLAEYGKKVKADALQEMKRPGAGDDPNANKEDANVSIARMLGKASAEGSQAANDVLDAYLIK